jgi:hypothetical protein
MATRLIQISLAIAATSCFWPERSGQAQDSSPARAWLAERLAEFREYRFEQEAAEPIPLTMAPNSLLNWSNPERGTGSGGLFLWTLDGRPQMIACAFEHAGSLKHEFHSLSTAPLAAQRLGAPVHRFGPGAAWSELSGAPEPARTRPLRLAQMRRLAERFRVSVGRVAAGREEWAQTRLLPQPIFRWPESAGDDGAVFVFVQGTDPECMLLLESLEAARWRYALTRQTKWALKAELDGRVIWERDPNHRPERTPETPFLVLAQEPNSRAAPVEQ